MKQFTALLCALILILSIPFVAHADDEIYTEGTLYYTIGDETVTIVGCFGYKTEVTVPASIAGFPVNTIAAGAFMTNSSITLLKLPDTITTIEDGAIKDGIRVIYNANTNHPQEEVPDIITGREPILVPADSAQDQTSDDQKSNSVDAQSDKSNAQRSSSSVSSAEGDRVMEEDVDLTGEEASEKLSSASSSAAAENPSLKADASASSEMIEEQSSDAAIIATPDETGGSSTWLIIIIAAVGIVIVAFVILMIRKKTVSSK